MISKPVKWVLEIAICLVILMTGWIVHQSNHIDHLISENEAKAQIITQQEKVNQALTRDLESERQAVQFREKLANELKEQANATRETMRNLLKNEPCAHTQLPDAAIKRLRNPKNTD